MLTAMTLAQAIETMRIHSVAGLTGKRMALVTTRPCRAPYQTISAVRLIGGGHISMPGERPRVHHGLLFLDELPEYKRHVLAELVHACRPLRARKCAPRNRSCFSLDRRPWQEYRRDIFHLPVRRKRKGAPPSRVIRPSALRGRRGRLCAVQALVKQAPRDGAWWPVREQARPVLCALSL